MTDAIRRLVFQGSPRQRFCDHLDEVAVVDDQEPVCPRCLAEGTRWVHVRMCMVCGERGCCDSSSARHARRHFEESGHPLIRSIEPREHWGWCYLDKAYLPERDYLA